MSGPLTTPSEVPEWLRPLVESSAKVDSTAFTRVTPPPYDARRAAVLMLFGIGEHGPDVLLLRRADTLGSHAGQVAFPGGGAEEGEDPVATALREAEEETGVLPEGIHPVAVFPELYVPVSRFAVTPVLAHWHQPSPVRPVDPAETAAVARVPIDRGARRPRQPVPGRPAGWRMAWTRLHRSRVVRVGIHGRCAGDITGAGWLGQGVGPHGRARP